MGATAAFDRVNIIDIVTLDATAAFDKVNIYNLLSKLIYRGIACDIIHMLHSWYCNSRACIRMLGYCAEYIDIQWA